ncbi:tailor [Haematobia irritans]|uniref:tailor n=1 Tax=Haematobia irritans TaxID=7368 RepID=UPI003F4F915B
MAAVQHYIHPITYEANQFAKSLEVLSSVYNVLDPELIDSLENVMESIGRFIANAKSEIVPTQTTKLVDVDSLSSICRVYRCIPCKKDLGKNLANVMVHITKECKAIVGESARQKPTIEERKQRKNDKKGARLAQAIVLRKKAKFFLSSDSATILRLLSDATKIGDKLKFIPDYKIIENDLLELIKPLFPNQTIKIYYFGSRLCGIGSRDSDLDIFVDIGETFHTHENRVTDEILSKFEKVQKALKSHPKSWKGLVVVKKARVPILKIMHSNTSIECDINFSHSLGHINTLMLDYIFTLQPLARIMCIYVKKWIHHTGFVNEISTYSMNLMVIFYLQILNLLPPLEKLFRNVDKETALSVGPWLATYQPLTLKELDIKPVDPINVRSHILQFFKYFSDFDYQNLIVCPYFGCPLKKDTFITMMPNRYTSYIEKNNAFALESEKPIVVQDPIQLNHNVTKGMTAFNLNVLKGFMSKSIEIIAQTDK